MLPNLSALCLQTEAKRTREDDGSGDENLDPEVLSQEAFAELVNSFDPEELAALSESPKRKWGILVANQEFPFNEKGERQLDENELPKRSTLVDLLENDPSSLNVYTTSGCGIDVIKENIKSKHATAFVVDWNPNDGKWVLVGAIALARNIRSDHYTIRPSEWTNELRLHSNPPYKWKLDRMDKVTGKVGVDDPKKDLAQITRNLLSMLARTQSRAPHRGAVFYFSWVCSIKLGDYSPTGVWQPQTGIGTLLVKSMANYVDNVYVKPTALVAARELWPGIELGSSPDTQSTLYERTLTWVRRHAFFYLLSLTRPRPFWEDAMGFRQFEGNYVRDEARDMARLVFPDLETNESHGRSVEMPGSSFQQALRDVDPDENWQNGPIGGGIRLRVIPPRPSNLPPPSGKKPKGKQWRKSEPMSDEEGSSSEDGSESGSGTKTPELPVGDMESE